MGKTQIRAVAIAIGVMLAGSGAARPVPIPPVPDPMPDTHTINNDPQRYATGMNSPRLDRNKDGNIPFVTCLLNGTYDPNAWDQNLNPTIDPFKSPFASDVITPGVSAIEVVEWSWAKRARCQTALGTASADATGFLAVGFLWAAQVNANKPNAVKSVDLTRIGIITLLPAVVDNLRAVGPTRLYYTSAVLGTAMMSARNRRLEADLNELGRLDKTFGTEPAWPAAANTTPYTAASGPVRTCNMMAPITFELHETDAPGIQSAQSQLTVDINNYRAWCTSVQAVFDKAWTLQESSRRILDGFESDRTLTWRTYANAINTGGYQQQATTASVLHTIVTLPVTVASDIVGTNKKLYSLGDGRTTLNATDAATLPVAAGDYSLTPPTTDLVAITIAIDNDSDALNKLIDDFQRKRGLTQKQITAVADDQSALNRLLTPANRTALFQQSQQFSAYYQRIKDLLADISAQNSHRYLILDLNAGGAYLADQSLSAIKATGSGGSAVTATPASDPKTSGSGTSSAAAPQGS